MSIELRQRSPLGSFYRSPLGVFGVAGAAELGLQPTVGTWTTVAFEAIPGFFQVADTEGGPCGMTLNFMSGPGFVFSQWRHSGVQDPGLPVEQTPNLTDLWGYTIVGDTSGARFKPADAVPYACWNGLQNTGDGISETAGWIGGALPAPDNGLNQRGTYLSPGGAECRYCTPAGSQASHPAFIANESFVAYPDDLLPPP